MYISVLPFAMYIYCMLYKHVPHHFLTSNLNIAKEFAKIQETHRFKGQINDYQVYAVVYIIHPTGNTMSGRTLC